MATTSNLAVTKIEASQAQKEVTANQAFDVFDAALTEKAISMSDADYTLSTSTVPQEWQYSILKFTGTLTANRNVVCPTNKKPYIIVNGTTGGFSLTLKTSAGTGIAVTNGKTAILRCDGTNVEPITPGAGTGSGTVTSINITQPAAGITASGGPITTSGAITLALANDLAAVEGLSATGLVRRTGADTWTAGTTISTGEIADDAVTYAKLQDVSATDKLLGRSTAGAGNVEEITCTAAGRALLDDADAAAQRATLGTVAAASFPVVIQLAASDETTALTSGTAKLTFRMPHAMTLTAVRASLTTASSSGVVTVDINESGSTILSTKLTIDASELTSTTAATAAVISDSSLADDAEITIDIDGAGSGAKGLKVTLIGTRSV
jgi:hypothetical protein